MPLITHLEQTFRDAERSHPDLLEPYSSRLAEAESADTRVAIMQAGLRETFQQRYPMPDGFYDRNRGAAQQTESQS